MLQRRDERKPDRVVLDHESAGSRHRLEPRHLGRDVQVLDDRLLRRARSPSDARRRFARLEHVEADVRRDPVEPRPERRPALEAVDPPPGPHERVLDGVLGIERRAEHPVAVPGQLRAVLLELAGEQRGGRGGPFPSTEMLRLRREPTSCPSDRGRAPDPSAAPLLVGRSPAPSAPLRARTAIGRRAPSRRLR